MISRRASGITSVQRRGSATPISVLRLIALLLPSLLVVIGIGALTLFLSKGGPALRRRVYLETPPRRGPTVQLQPNAYVRQASKAGTDVGPGTEGSCAAWVQRHTVFEESEMQPGRALPAFQAGDEPTVCAWHHDRPLNKTTWESLRQGPRVGCGPNTVRYKLYGGVLYRDRRYREHSNAGAVDSYAPTVEELVLLAAHLYLGLLPDMDFIVDYGDAPSTSCVAPTLALARDVNTPTGCTLPVPRMWQELSPSRGQMESFLQCVDAKYGSQPKIPKVLWRGSTTGGMRLRPENGTLPEDWRARLLHNSRLFAAVLARNYGWLDVGITDVHFGDFGAPDAKASGAGAAALSARENIEAALAVHKAPVAFEEGSRYAGTLVIEGHGFLGRLAPQLLLDSVNLMQERSVVEWCTHRLQPGVHYVPLRHDLADLLPQTFDLTQDVAAAGASEEWGKMVANSRGFALDHFSARSIVDVVAWALAEYHNNFASYQVDSPAADPTFEPVKHYEWSNPFLPAQLRKEVESRNPANFELDVLLGLRMAAPGKR